MLSTGNNIGITLAETPLMRKAFLMINLKSFWFAICLLIVRPAAKDARESLKWGFIKETISYLTMMLYLFSKIVGTDEEFADKLLWFL